jgi:prophage regulatory protein
MPNIPCGGERLLSMSQVLARTSISRTQLRRLWERDDFPRPVHLSERVLAFSESAVETWIEAKMKEGAA